MDSLPLILQQAQENLINGWFFAAY